MDTCPSIPKLDYVSSLLTSLAPSRDYSVGGVEGVGDLTATKYDFTSFHDSLNPKLLENEEEDYEFLETGFEDSYFLPPQGQCQCLGAESRKEKELDAFRKARLTIEAAITEWEIQPIHSHALEMVRNEARSYLSVPPFKPVKSLNSALDWKFFPDSTGKCSVKDFERAKVQTQGYLCSAFKTIRRNLTSNKDPHCKYLSTPPERGVHSILRDRSQRLVPPRVTPTGLDPCGTLCGSSSYWTNHFYRFKASYLGTCEIPRGCQTNAAPCFGQTAVSDSQFSPPFDCYTMEYPEFSKNAMHTPDPCNFYPEHVYYDSQGLSTPYKKHV